jgi:hypothetical protein
VTGTVDRRRTKRLTPLIDCEIDIGFAKAKKAASAEIVNISDTGILLRTSVPTSGAGYVYDVATLTLRPAGGEPIMISAKILRVEADSKSRGSEKKVFMAFAYEKIDEDARKLLSQYLQMNDPTTDAAAKN